MTFCFFLIYLFSNNGDKTPKQQTVGGKVMSVLTKEGLVEAIQKSKATTVSGLWKYLGHKSAISGSQSKKIKELVPNHEELFSANKTGTVVEAEKTPVETNAPASKEKVGGFRNGTHYAILFAEGNKGFIDRKELITKVAQLTGRPEKLVKYDYGVMQCTAHKSNRNRAKVIEDSEGKVRIVAA